MSKIAIVIFDRFTDIDLWLMWDLLNRVRVDDWSVKIVGEREKHVSVTGIETAKHGRLDEAKDANAVLFVSGPGTRERITDEAWLSKLDLDPERQLIGSICSSSALNRSWSSTLTASTAMRGRFRSSTTRSTGWGRRSVPCFGPSLGPMPTRRPWCS